MPPILLGSPSILELQILARSKSKDCTHVLKEYYNWQHKVLLAVITGIATFIGGSVVLVIEAATGEPDATGRLNAILGHIVVATVFAATLIFLALCAVCVFVRLLRLPREYMTSITLYQRLR